jgi:pyruvate-ferredoxin/flavodoxin oxidoreductase
MKPELEYFLQSKSGKKLRIPLSGLSASRMVESCISEGICAPFQDDVLPKANIFGRTPLLKTMKRFNPSYIEGLSHTGIRACGFCESSDFIRNLSRLFAATWRRLSYVLHCVHGITSHHSFADMTDFHATIAETGFFALSPSSVKEVIDFTLIAHRIAETALTPGVILMDPVALAFAMEECCLPEKQKIMEWAGSADDFITCPTPAQQIIFGNRRRRIPNNFSPDYPILSGPLRDSRSGALESCSQRLFFADQLLPAVSSIFAEYRQSEPTAAEMVSPYYTEDAEAVVLVHGALFRPMLEVVEKLRRTEGLPLGLVKLSVLHPVPEEALMNLLSGKKAVCLFAQLTKGEPYLFRKLKSAFFLKGENPHLSLCLHPLGISAPKSGEIAASLKNSFAQNPRSLIFTGVELFHQSSEFPKQEIFLEEMKRHYPELALLSPGREELPPPSSDGFSLAYCTTGFKNVLAQEFEGFGILFQKLFGYRFYSNAAPENANGFFLYQLSFFREQCTSLSGELPLNGLVTTLGGLNHLGKLPERLQKHGHILLILENEEKPSQLLPDIQTEIIRRNINLHVLSRTGISLTKRDMVQHGAISLLFLSSLICHKDDFREKLPQAINEYFSTAYIDVNPEKRAALAELLLNEIKSFDSAALSSNLRKSTFLPPAVIRRYEEHGPVYTRLSNFFDRSICFYESGQTGEITANPFQAMPALPSGSAALRDLSRLGRDIPHYNKQLCTGCGECFVHCPNSALPPSVFPLETLLRTGMEMASAQGVRITVLTPTVKNLARLATKALNKIEGEYNFIAVLEEAFEKLLEQMKFDENREQAIRSDFNAVKKQINLMPVAVTDRFFRNPEKFAAGSGELFTIHVDPRSCHACGTCCSVCPSGALELRPPDEERFAAMSQSWNIFENLPDTSGETIRKQLADENANPLAALLLSRNFHFQVLSGSEPSSGSAKTILHNLTAITESMMQPRLNSFIQETADLAEKIRDGIREKLYDSLPTGDLKTIEETLRPEKKSRLPFKEFIERLQNHKHLPPLDISTIKRQLELVEQLENLSFMLSKGPTGQGRSRFGLIIDEMGDPALNYPDNPFFAPVFVNYNLKSPSVIRGLFDGHLRHFLDNLRIYRRAVAEAANNYYPPVNDPQIAALCWDDLDEKEKKLLPPLFLISDSRHFCSESIGEINSLLSSNLPLRLILFDTAGSGSMTPAQYASLNRQLLLFGLQNQNALILQSMITESRHFYNGFQKILQSSRPALVHLHSPNYCQEGYLRLPIIARKKLALISRAFPLLFFDAEHSNSIGAGLNLDGNPEPENLTLRTDLSRFFGDNREKHISEVLFAHFAAVQPAFKDCFRELSRQDNPLSIFEYLELPPAEQKKYSAFIPVYDSRGRRDIIVDDSIVYACKTAKNTFRTLQELAGITSPLESVVREKLQARFIKEKEMEIAAVKEAAARELEEKMREYDADAAIRLKQRLLELAKGK